MLHPWEQKRPISAWLPGGLSRARAGKVSRNHRPVMDGGKCIKCSSCWIYCPEGCISRGDSFTINYDYCRGCGICATECPKEAIVMIREERV